MRELNISESFPVSVSQFFDLVFQSPKFKLDFHLVRGDSEISVGDWKQLGTNKYERLVKFCSQISDQVIFKKLTGGIAPVIQEKQTYEFVDQEVHVYSVATTSTGGFQCSTISDYTVVPKDLPGTSRPDDADKAHTHGACHVDITVKNEFKSRLFKGQVENMMHQTATQTFEQWTELVNAKIREFQKEEKLKNPPNHNGPSHQPPAKRLSSTDVSDALSNSEYDETDDDNSEIFFDAHEGFHTSPLSSRTSTSSSIVGRTSPTHNTTHNAAHNTAHTGSGSGSGGGNTSQFAVLVHGMQKELQQVKSMIEVNSSRLLGMEAAFASLSQRPPAPSSKHPSASTPSTPHGANEGVLPYLQRLDTLIKHQEEEAQRSKEKELEWKRRLEEMESKLEGSQRRLIPRGWVRVGVVVFLLAWPVIGHRLWKYAKVMYPVVEKAILRMLGR